MPPRWCGPLPGIILRWSACLAATGNTLRSQDCRPGSPSFRQHVDGCRRRLKAHGQAGTSGGHRLGLRSKSDTLELRAIPIGAAAGHKPETNLVIILCVGGAPAASAYFLHGPSLSAMDSESRLQRQGAWPRATGRAKNHRFRDCFSTICPSEPSNGPVFTATSRRGLMCSL